MVLKICWPPQNKSLLLEKKDEPESTSLKILLYDDSSETHFAQILKSSKSNMLIINFNGNLRKERLEAFPLELDIYRELKLRKKCRNFFFPNTALPLINEEEKEDTKIFYHKEFNPSTNNLLSQKKHPLENIFILNLNGTTLCTQLNLESSTISDLYKIVDTTNKIPQTEIRLVFQNKELNNQITLKKLGLKNNDTIQLKLRLKGGKKSLDEIIDNNDKQYLIKYSENILMWHSAAKHVNDKPNKDYTLVFDGNCKPNPGNGGAGFIIKDNDNNEIIYQISIHLGKVTNNEAEYYGLIFGLYTAFKLGISRLCVYGDSQIVIEHLKGGYVLRAENLKPLYEIASKFKQTFEIINFTHHASWQNREADQLARKGINILNNPNQKPSKKSLWDSLYEKFDKLLACFSNKTNLQTRNTQPVRELFGQEIQQYLYFLKNEVDIFSPELCCANSLFNIDNRKVKEAAESIVVDLFNIKAEKYAYKGGREDALRINEPFTKPIIIIANTGQLSLNEETCNTTNLNEIIKGTHWITFVYLPPNFKGLLSYHEDESEEKWEERFILFDSLPLIKTIPTTLKDKLCNGFFRKYDKSPQNSKEAEITYLNPIGKTTKFITRANRTQQGYNTCGYWAIFNAIMTVLTGSDRFYERFSVEISKRKEMENNLIEADRVLIKLLNKLKSITDELVNTYNQKTTPRVKNTINPTQNTNNQDLNLNLLEHIDKPSINNNLNTPSKGIEQEGPKKRDGTPDMRYSINKETIKRGKSRGKTRLDGPEDGFVPEKKGLDLNRKGIKKNKKAKETPAEGISNENPNDSGEKKIRIDIDNHKTAWNDFKWEQQPTQTQLEDLNSNFNNDELPPEDNMIEEIARNAGEIDENAQHQTNTGQRNPMSLKTTEEYIIEIDSRLKKIENDRIETCSSCKLNITKIVELSQKLKSLESKFISISNENKKLEAYITHNEKQTKEIWKNENEYKINIQEAIDDININFESCKEMDNDYAIKLSGLENTSKILEEKIRQLTETIEQQRQPSKMEIEDILKGNSNSSINITKDHLNDLEERFEKLSIRVSNDHETKLNKINDSQIKINELIKKSENQKKQYTIKDSNASQTLFMEMDKKITDLEIFVRSKIENIQREITDIGSSKLPPNEWDKIMEEIEKVHQNCEGHLEYLSNTINKKVIPCIEKADRKADGVTNRLDTLYRARNPNTDMKDKEQKGIHINTEPLDKILHAKREPRNFSKGLRLTPIAVNEQSKDLAEDFLQGKKYKIHLEFAPDEDPNQFFREVYVEYGQNRRKAKLYFSKIGKDSTCSDQLKPANETMLIENNIEKPTTPEPDYRLGEKSPSPNNLNH